MDPNEPYPQSETNNGLPVFNLRGETVRRNKFEIGIDLRADTEGLGVGQSQY
jgi:hypothetical protein